MRYRRVPTRRRFRTVWTAAGLVALSFGVVALSGCTAAQHVQIAAGPTRALFDVPVAVQVSGLQPGQPVRVDASSIDANGTSWTSDAQFAASTSGTVNLADAALPSSTSAVSYTGRDPMGLFELMRPATGTATVFSIPKGGFTVRLRVLSGSTLLTSTVIDREDPLSLGVRATHLTVANDGVAGTLYQSAAESRLQPAVLAFGGSGGGEEQDLNALALAGHGYTTLSLAYFNAPGLPTTLQRIPLEYFQRALRFLATQPGIDPARINVFGDSRGSEAAQLLGVDYPDLVYGVIAAVPSDHTSNGTNGTTPAWTLNGRAVPTAPSTDVDQPQPSDATSSIIAVQKIRGPLMTTCGQDDAVWPSCTFAASIHARRTAAHHADGDISYTAPGAGHGIFPTIGYLPVTQQGSANGQPFGGTLQADLTGAATAHLDELAFLQHQTR